MKDITVVDLGSYSFKILTGKYDNTQIGDVNLLEKECKSCISKGAIIRASSAKKALKELIDIATKDTEYVSSQVYVVLSNPNIIYKNIKESLLLKQPNEEEPKIVREEDLEKLKLQVEKKAIEPGYEIIHLIPQRFILDGQEYYEPLDLVAEKIEAEFHAILIPSYIAQNIRRLFKGVEKKVEEIFFSPLVASYMLLQEEDFLENQNILLIDLGHTTSSYVWFDRGAPKISRCIDMGIYTICEKIATRYKLTLSEATKLLKEAGVASPLYIENKEEETTAYNRENQEISIKLVELAQIIEDVLSDIFTSIIRDLISQYKKEKKEEEKHKENLEESEGTNQEEELLLEISEIILIGGGANIKHIKDYLYDSLEIPTRIGKVELKDLISEEYRNPTYCAVTGAVYYKQKLSILYGGILDKKETEGSFLTLPSDYEFIQEEEFKPIKNKREKKGFINTLKNLLKGIKKLFSEE